MTTRAVCALGQCLHWGSDYTGTGCILGQYVPGAGFILGLYVHWVSLYDGAVCTLGQYVH